MKTYSKITLAILTSTLLINTGCVSGMIKNTQPSAQADYNTETEEKPNVIVAVIDDFIGDIMERVTNKTDNAEVKSQQQAIQQEEKFEQKKEVLLDKWLGKDSKYNLKGGK